MRSVAPKVVSSANKMLIVLLLHLFIICNEAQDILFGQKKYTEYQVGNMNLIITVPHGGSIQPSEIPSRDAGCWDKVTSTCIYTHSCPSGTAKDSVNCKVTTVKDLYTLELALTLAKEICNLTSGLCPHIIINHLSRTKLDPNRDKEEASFGVPQAEQAWNEFMDFIHMAKSNISKGLLIDIHGQSHPEQWIELGYTISRANLDSSKFSAKDSSTYSLSNDLYNVPFETLLRGNRSFGKFIEEQNQKYVCVPSPTNPGPNGGNYFSGGYIIQTHGSKSHGKVDAIQIELPKWIREIDERPRFCAALAKAIKNFFQSNYENSEIMNQKSLKTKIPK
ncbi:uncharacterized protein LOC128655704 [Bombina bombina]|uniref:uncharacterized protein LOC128655704 n=1 Tax=Bombina bombina TaxID=8345 RepID=UPI00235A6A17|nr:uncharacterized protein LOC128655704 [Bombina bombina]